MDSSSTAEFELLVALAKGIGYKDEGRRVLKVTAQGCGKKPYEKPMLMVYGDIRTMTQSHASTAGNSDGRKIGKRTLKTG